MHWEDQPSQLDRVREARSPQLRELERLLVVEGHRVVGLYGAPGSGKTSLAMLFADRHEINFPGGTVRLQAHGDLKAYRRLISELLPDAPALIVLDEMDMATIDTIGEEFAHIAQHRPMARVLMTSNIRVLPTPTTQTVEMPPLGPAAVVSLLRQGADIDPKRLRGLAEILEGNVSAVSAASRRLASGVPPDRILEWLQSRELTVARDPEGQALKPGTHGRRALDTTVTEISDELISSLAAEPELLYQIDPRKFEMLVAELYRRRGFEATLTPASGDGGADVYVVRHDELGSTLWVVQAKRWAAKRKIGAGVVRELYGTVTAKNASAGVLVTTSFFEPGAERLTRELNYRLNLRDYFGLQDMLRWPTQGDDARPTPNG